MEQTPGPPNGSEMNSDQMPESSEPKRRGGKKSTGHTIARRCASSSSFCRCFSALTSAAVGIRAPPEPHRSGTEILGMSFREWAICTSQQTPPLGRLSFDRGLGSEADDGSIRGGFLDTRQFSWERWIILGPTF